MKHIKDFEKLIVQFDTGPIPPPFCYRYKLEISPESSSRFLIDLDLEYYDRDELSEEEIFEEGFSLDDNFKWKGSLPETWGKEVIKNINSANWTKKITPNLKSTEFRIKIFYANHPEFLKPNDVRQWEIFTQEIIQAAFELGKKEAPLILSFVTKSANDSIKIVNFEFSFATRSIDIKAKDNHQDSMDWKSGQKLLKYIFGIDYSPENGFEQIPKKTGNFISPGDGFWYELKYNKDVGQDTNDKIERLVETLLKYTK